VDAPAIAKTEHQPEELETTRIGASLPFYMCDSEMAGEKGEILGIVDMLFRVEVSTPSGCSKASPLPGL
jgi:hypothetical protein